MPRAASNTYGPKSLLLAFSVGFLLASVCWHFSSTPKPAVVETPVLSSSMDKQGIVLIHTQAQPSPEKLKAWTLKIHNADGALVKTVAGQGQESLPKDIPLGKQPLAVGWTYDLAMVTEHGIRHDFGTLAKTLKPKNIELTPQRFDTKAKLTKHMDLLQVTQPDATRREDNEAEALSISITLTKPSTLVIDIFDSSDRRVKRLFEGPHEAGLATFSFDGYDSEGAPALPGKYRVVADWDGEIVEKWVTLQ